jgi:hypothetical protein
MTPDVTGSGFGRTGARSLKDALEILGLGPCHHREEVLVNPPSVAYWQANAAGQEVDLTEVFAGNRSQVDWPGSYVWRQSAARFPQAKVVHSVRRDEAWWKSYSCTIGKLMTVCKTLPLPPLIAAMMIAFDDVLVRPSLGGNPLEKASCLAACHARQAEVEAAIPAARLLVFEVAQGWEPLCAFLGVPVPDLPFPHRNLRDDFWANPGGDPA